MTGDRELPCVDHIPSTLGGYGKINCRYMKTKILKKMICIYNLYRKKYYDKVTRETAGDSEVYLFGIFYKLPQKSV